MRKEHAIYINKREIPANYKMFLCHNTMEFDGIQPQDVYSLFLRDYSLTTDTLIDYIHTLASYQDYDRYDALYLSIDRGEVKTYLTRSLLLASWYTTYYYDYNVFKKAPIYINQLISAGVNYSRLEFGEQYNSLYPHTKFYKKLTLNVDMSRYHPIYDKDYITVEDIKEVLKDYKGVSYESIKEDLEHHCIITPYKDYYIWGSKVLYQWFLDIDPSRLYIMNINKILSRL